MTMTTIGDLAQMLAQRHHQARLSGDLVRLSTELTTGQVQDATRKLGGDLSALTGIDRGLARLAAFDLAIGEGLTRAGAAELRLDRISQSGEALAGTLTRLSASPLSKFQSEIAEQAKASLEDAVQQLNGSVAGRSLFSGTASDRKPLPDADTILVRVQSAIGAAQDATQVFAAIDAWLNDPAGFEATVYNGAEADRQPVETSEGHRISPDIKASERALSETLAFRALTVLAAEDSIGLSAGDTREIFAMVDTRLGAAQDGVISLRAEIGLSQFRLEDARTRQEAERFALSEMRNGLVGIDPFSTATELQAVQQNLEGLYAVTARSARLSLVGFLK